MRKRWFTFMGWMMAGSASLVGVAACGSGFAAGDCQASRTCVDDSDGSAGAGADGAGTPGAAGEPGVGVAGTLGAAGAGHEPTKPKDNSQGGDSAQGGSTDSEGGAGGAAVVVPPNVPPSVTAVTPTAADSAADPDAAVVVTFSEPLDPATVTDKTVQLLHGTEVVAASLTLDGSTITLTPDVPLFMLADYELDISNAVTDLEGAALAAPFSSKFTTRDGAWKTSNAVAGSLAELTSALSLTATGEALVAWTVATGGCPTSARRFVLGTAIGAVSAFDAGDSGCSGVTAASNSQGVGAVAWTTTGGSAGKLAQQFRGSWLAKPSVVSTDTTLVNARIAVAPNGMLTLIAHLPNGGSKAFRTDAAGKWAAQPDSLSSLHALSPASIAFAKNGDGLAVWAAQSNAGRAQILASRYTSATGKWSSATAIPNSYANNPYVELLQSAPALAMTEDGDAVAAWTESETDVGTQVSTSVFSHLSGWRADVLTLGGLDIYTGAEAPGLAYDGQRFLLAWTASADYGGPNSVHVRQYEAGAGAWTVAAPEQGTNADGAAPKMPRIASDGRGGSMLVWAKPAGAGAFTLLYERATDGDFGAATAVPGGSVSSKSFATDTLVLAMNGSGMAALTWGNRDAKSQLTGIRLASFF